MNPELNFMSNIEISLRQSEVEGCIKEVNFAYEHFVGLFRQNEIGNKDHTSFSNNEFDSATVSDAVYATMLLLREHIKFYFERINWSKFNESTFKMIWFCWLQNRTNVFVKFIDTLAFISEALLYIHYIRNEDLKENIKQAMLMFVQWFGEHLKSEFLEEGGWNMLKRNTEPYNTLYAKFCFGLKTLVKDFYLYKNLKYTNEILNILSYSSVEFPVPISVFEDPRLIHDPEHYHKKYFVYVTDDYPVIIGKDRKQLRVELKATVNKDKSNIYTSDGNKISCKRKAEVMENESVAVVKDNKSIDKEIKGNKSVEKVKKENKSTNKVKENKSIDEEVKVNQSIDEEMKVNQSIDEEVKESQSIDEGTLRSKELYDKNSDLLLECFLNNQHKSVALKKHFVGQSYEFYFLSEKYHYSFSELLSKIEYPFFLTFEMFGTVDIKQEISSWEKIIPIKGNNSKEIDKRKLSQK